MRHHDGGTNGSDARGGQGHDRRTSLTTLQCRGSVNLGKWDVLPDDEDADIGFGFFDQDGDDQTNDHANPRPPDRRDVDTNESPWSPSLLAG